MRLTHLKLTSFYITLCYYKPAKGVTLVNKKMFAGMLKTRMLHIIINSLKSLFKILFLGLSISDKFIQMLQNL